MIIRLDKKQVADNWDIIEFGILSSFPPTAQPSEGKEILEALLTGSMQCWVLMETLEDKEYLAVATTIKTRDYGSGEWNLLIYSLFRYQDEIPSELWKDGFVKLSNYARSQGCRKIVAFSNLEKVCKLSKWLGGDTSFRLITFNL